MGEDVIGVEANRKIDKGDKDPGDEKDKKESFQVTNPLGRAGTKVLNLNKIFQGGRFIFMT